MVNGEKGKAGLPRIDSVYANLSGSGGLPVGTPPAVPPKEKKVEKKTSVEGMESELGDWLKLSGMLDRL